MKQISELSENDTTGCDRVSARRVLIVVVVVILAFTLSIVVRIKQFNNYYNFIDVDASYHVLLTIAALQETPISVHRFLPIVSLGTPSDKGIPWGATIPDVYGNYYYTSFPQLGFLLPWLIFSFLSLSVTIYN